MPLLASFRHCWGLQSLQPVYCASKILPKISHATLWDIKPWIISTQMWLTPTKPLTSPTWGSAIGQSDHFSLLLLYKYSPLIKSVKPTIRSIKIWLESADSDLQHQFQHTDWSVFAAHATKDSQMNTDSYTSSGPGAHQQVCGQSGNTKANKSFPQSETLDE